VLVALAGGWVDEVFQSLVVPLGVWLFFSPLFLGFSSLAFLANNIGVTFAVIAAAAISEALRSPASAEISPPQPV